MKKFSKKLLSILSLTIFGLLFVNAPTTSAETLESENLVKLEYTIDEIKKMSLGEYYQNIFPETFNEFDLETRAELFATPYSTQTLDEKNRIIDAGLMTASSTLSKVSSSEIKFSAKTQMNFTDGSKAKKIHHSSIIYDDKGSTWMIRSESKTDSNYFNMSGPKSIKKGKYKMETVHTVDMPSGYWPQSTSRTTTSAWLTVN
ncbi:MAG: hypothetical protein ACLTA9_12300 [Clostridium saudiense]